MPIKLKASYIVAGAVIVTAAAVTPATTLAKSVSGKFARMSAPIHANIKAAQFRSFPGLSKRLVVGEVTAISGSTLTVNQNGTSYSVDASSAKFLAFGSSGLSLSNIRIGDKVTVLGTITGNSVAAKSLSDASLLGRDIFVGTVTAKNGSVLSVSAKAQGGSSAAYLVDVSSASMSRLGKSGSSAIALSDVNVGDYVKAAGSLSGSSVTARALVDFGPIKAEKPAADVHSGTVTAISGAAITLKSAFGKTQSVYTVDAAAARITKGRGAGTAIAVSEIAVGDRIMVSGPVNGTSIAATAIRDLGAPAMGKRARAGIFGRGIPAPSLKAR